jgi:hypothetical protein
MQHPLRNYEKSIYSQNGQDGIIEQLYNILNLPIKNNTYFEIGTEDGSQCNTRYFREHHNWYGIMLDGGYQNPNINLFQHIVNAENICDILKRYQCPKHVNFLSLDIDYNTFYVLGSLLNEFSFDVIDVEYNSSYKKDWVVQYDPNGKWDGSNYFGASLKTIFKLCKDNGYSLVYSDANGADAFFVKDNLIKNLDLPNINDPNKLYTPPRYGDGKGHPEDIFKRKGITYKEARKVFEKTSI